ncbi:hypothetical protein AXG93_977s1080 [Marchantia polymorpha subsp. ruderalis]|uniref:Mediator of RNA polymerase II transcription subunit 7 n=1 Tax=Marchantia polymorpha subsp. ruderalis TaxID=1480154 RepID=A0A176WC63_MARPO|nr:hypothetical protein AXG93_977s1080 [Marchantia polymorpha subsp. ruderalis]
MAASAYPPPPPYYRLYKDFSENPDSCPAPPPPVVGTYNLFGANYTTDDVLPSLEEQGLRQLYPTGPNVDYKKELRSLNRELSFQFLELSDVLVERPSQYARRVEDMGLILRNMHHLLNSLRPHQARATLIHILESQIQRRKKAVADIRRAITFKASISYSAYLFGNIDNLSSLSVRLLLKYFSYAVDTFCCLECTLLRIWFLSLYTRFQGLSNQTWGFGSTFWKFFVQEIFRTSIDVLKEIVKKKREEVRQMLQESLSTLDGHMNDMQQDGGMAASLMESNLGGQKNGMKNYGFGAAQTYR